MKQSLYARFLRGSRLKVVALSLLGSFTSLCGVLLALLSKNVVDTATGQMEGNLFIYALALGGIILLQLLLQALLTTLNVHTVASMRFRMQAQVFEGFLHKQKLSTDRLHSGEWVNRIAGDTAILAEGIIGIIPSLVSVLARILFSFCALLMLDSVLALLSLIAGILVLMAAQIYRKKTGLLFKKSRESEGRIRSFIQETVQNLAVIKAFSVYSVVNRQLGRAQDEAFNLTVRKNKISLALNICFYVTMTCGYYLALAWGAWQLFKGAMSFGTLTAILGLMGDMTVPFKELTALFPKYASVSASAERLQELEDLPFEGIADPVETAEFYDSLQEIRLVDIDFSYGDMPVLKKASASFPKGSLTAVTGESGAGKSTLLNLLAGILTPDGGEILLDTQNDSFSLCASHRGLFAYVPQDFLLLSGTVLENITLFDETPDMERFSKAVQMAELTEVIAGLPQGVDTFLGEGAGRLSGGQRQRMALARALYSHAEILLLDEATSALSRKTEERILESLRESQKTVIFVTHRHTAVGLCDRVLAVDGGEITI